MEIKAFIYSTSFVAIFMKLICKISIVNDAIDRAIHISIVEGTHFDKQDFKDVKLSAYYVMLL